MTDIIVKNINIKMLRKQRDLLLETEESLVKTKKQLDALSGIINLIDYMLDIAEGYEHLHEKIQTKDCVQKFKCIHAPMGTHGLEGFILGETYSFKQSCSPGSKILKYEVFVTGLCSYTISATIANKYFEKVSLP